MKMTDVHCHILPGVDDGAKDAMETRSMLEMAWNEGIRTIFATSHYDSEMGTGIWKRRKEALEQTRRMAAEISPELKIASGAEIFFSEKAVEELEKGRIWTMNQSRYVLVEFFPGEEFFYIQRGLQTLQYKGFWPILAHVERYSSDQCFQCDRAEWTPGEKASALPFEGAPDPFCGNRRARKPAQKTADGRVCRLYRKENGQRILSKNMPGKCRENNQEGIHSCIR